MTHQSIGVLGLGVMGQNVARNFRSHGAHVVVFNRTGERTTEFLAGPAKGAGILGAYTLNEFVAALPRPRRILLMIQAGDAVDAVLDELTGILEPDDIVIDGGNSYFRDTERRATALAEKGLRFLGMGISGGEEGALKGPSLMPGGDKDAYKELEPLLTAIAAKSPDGPCVTYIGPGGSGHLVKMVHNGIEYGDMQLIAEAYDILHTVGQLTADQLHQIFTQWNQTDLQSFLIEITARIVNFPDDQDKGLLLDKILDSAGQKGTGRWTIQLASELGAPVPTIAAAVDARAISGMRDERLLASQILGTELPSPIERPDQLVDHVRSALLASKICSYAQGMVLLRTASQEFHYDLRYAEIARIWQAGCIIRARILRDISKAFHNNPNLPNLLLDPHFADRISLSQAGWRTTVALAAHTGVPTPAISASLAYFDSYRRDRLPAYLIQAQRDLFGAHTYQRVDKPGIFHTHWPPLNDAK